MCLGQQPLGHQIGDGLAHSAAAHVQLCRQIDLSLQLEARGPDAGGNLLAYPRFNLEIDRPDRCDPGLGTQP